MYTQTHTVPNDSGCPIRMSTVRDIHNYSDTPGLNRAAQRNTSDTKRTWMHDRARRWLGRTRTWHITRVRDHV